METIIVSLAGSFFLIAAEGIDIIARNGFSGSSHNAPVPARKTRSHKGMGSDAQGAYDTP
jgi:hypothetical protein